MQPPFPHKEERLTNYADRVGRWYAALVSAEHQKRLGQYLTPWAADALDLSTHCVTIEDANG